jgi:hypothetical protein
MSPEESKLILKVKKLIEERKVFVDDIFKDEDILDYANNFKPEDVFHEIALELWALENGFSKR